MATLREYILSQSTLPTGNTVRDHIQNPITGGGGDPYPVFYQDISIEAVSPDMGFAVEVVEQAVQQDDIDLETSGDIEISTNNPDIKMETD